MIKVVDLTVKSGVRTFGDLAPGAIFRVKEGECVYIKARLYDSGILAVGSYAVSLNKGGMYAFRSDREVVELDGELRVCER